MKIIVDELPYYGETCPLWKACDDCTNYDKCPRYWDKYKVCSDENPHKCNLLIEVGKLTIVRPDYVAVVEPLQRVDSQMLTSSLEEIIDMS